MVVVPITSDEQVRWDHHIIARKVDEHRRSSHAMAGAAGPTTSRPSVAVVAYPPAAPETNDQAAAAIKQETSLISKGNGHRLAHSVVVPLMVTRQRRRC